MKTKTKKLSPAQKEKRRYDNFWLSHEKAMVRLCGKGAFFCNYGWYQSDDRIESKVSNAAGASYVLVSDKSTGHLVHFKINR